jgi:hypothetical protein
MGNGVTSIGANVFVGCTNLTSVALPNSLTTIGGSAFDGSGLTSVTIPNSVTSIGDFAFAIGVLTNVTIGNSVTNIGDWAFHDCPRLTGAYFQGNAPTANATNVFYNDNIATVYYLPGTTGWEATFGGCPTALWCLSKPLILNSSPSFGIPTNEFGFTISWATNIPVVVEASTNLAIPSWSALCTNTLTNGACYFGDSDWTNHPTRLYRLRSP